MKELATAFENSVKQYNQWLQEVEQKQPLKGFTAIDFFSFEPFFPELNQLNAEDFQFYPDIESLPSDDIIEVGIDEGKIIFSRQYYGPTTFYDSFFFYTETEKWRYQIYTNGIETKPIFVEKLELGEHNTPITFKRYDTYCYLEIDYNHHDDGCDFSLQRFDKTGEPIQKEQYEVRFEDQKVASIENISQNRSLFNIHQKEELLEELLAKCKTKLVERMIRGVEKANIEQKDICALLVEYSLQGPFPASIGFAQESEKQEATEDYPPLAWLNAPDMELFFECEFFYPDEEGLYDEINARLDKLEFKEQKQLVFDFYADYCRTLQQSEKLKALIHTTEDFFVSACDYEEGNHWEFLEALLPKKQINQYQKEFDDYENNLKETLNNDKEYQDVIETLEDAEADYEAYLSAFNKQSCTVGYHEQLLYSIDPFFAPLTLKREGFAPIPLLKEKPEGSYYYQYHYVGEQILSIIYFHDDKHIFQIFFDYKEDQLTAGKFHGNPEEKRPSVEDYKELWIEDGKPTTLYEYTTIAFEKTDYHYNDKGQIVRFDEYKFMYSTEDNMRFDPVRWSKEIRYTADNQLRRITSTPVGHERSTVMYSIDDSFVLEAMEQSAEILSDIVIGDLEKRKSLPKGICFEVDPRLCFPPKVYYKPDKKWTEAQGLYGKLLGNKAVENSNLNLYLFHENYKEEGAYFSRSQCLEYIEQAYELICKKIEGAIREKFNATIEVKAKGMYEILNAEE